MTPASTPHRRYFLSVSSLVERGPDASIEIEIVDRPSAATLSEDSRAS